MGEDENMSQKHPISTPDPRTWTLNRMTEIGMRGVSAETVIGDDTHVTSRSNLDPVIESAFNSRCANAAALINLVEREEILVKHYLDAILDTRFHYL